MRVDDEIKYQIGLTLIDGVGDIIAKKLLIILVQQKLYFVQKRKN